MNLKELAGLLAGGGDPPSQDGLPSVEITGLEHDSRSVRAGDLFFCLRGRRYDGHLFAADAVAAGAAALAAERPRGLGVPEILVRDARRSMNRVAASFYGDPSRKLALVGVTGTNGKTTTTFLIHSIMKAAGWTAGLIGTVETRVPGESRPSLRTTPESVDLQRTLRSMVDAGARGAAMEVASHGVAEGRIEGTFFEVAVFTNLSQDHLDYHRTMDDYYAAKRSLFRPALVARSLINTDDAWGSRLLGEVRVPRFSFGIEGGDFSAVDVRTSARGSKFRAIGPHLDVAVTIGLPGTFNVSNALAAAVAAHLLDIGPDAIATGIRQVGSVPGRFEVVDAGQEFTVVVDYAHTPEGLHNVLGAARGIAEGRVIVVFGCGGDRDRTKRPMMGEEAARGADLVIVTSDNPRSEDPLSIIADIESGLRAVPPPLGYRVVPDRAEAIAEAILAGRRGDVVVIAGKGHETYQQYADHEISFDDRQVAAAALAQRR